MFTVHLSKPEATLDAVKKAYPKLRASDAALLATAIVLTGRYAIADYDGRQFQWTKDHDELVAAVAQEVGQIQREHTVKTKKAAKAMLEEEPAVVVVALTPNFAAAEKALGRRKDLIALLHKLGEEGLEYVYAPTDIGWQWALDRASWATHLNEELVRRVKIKTNFTEGAVGVEMGAAGTRKRASRAKASKAEKEAEVEPVEAAGE